MYWSTALHDCTRRRWHHVTVPERLLEESDEMSESERAEVREEHSIEELRAEYTSEKLSALGVCDCRPSIRFGTGMAVAFRRRNTEVLRVCIWMYT